MTAAFISSLHLQDLKECCPFFGCNLLFSCVCVCVCVHAHTHRGDIMNGYMERRNRMYYLYEYRGIYAWV